MLTVSTVSEASRFRYANVYAGIFTVGICGMVLDMAIVRSRRWFIPWQNEFDDRGL